MSTTEAKRIYREAADYAQAHLITLLRARGYTVELINHNVVAQAKTSLLYEDMDHHVETTIHVWPLYRRFFGEPNGISIRINRIQRAVTFSRKTDDYRAFDWDKILACVETDLATRVSATKARNAHEIEIETNKQLAQKEVPLPVGKANRFPFEEGPYMDGFRRTRQSNGTYTVSLDLNDFTAQETAAIRDVVLAREARLNHEKTTNTAASPPEEQEARTP